MRNLNCACKLVASERNSIYGYIFNSSLNTSLHVQSFSKHLVIKSLHIYIYIYYYDRDEREQAHTCVINARVVAVLTYVHHYCACDKFEQVTFYIKGVKWQTVQQPDRQASLPGRSKIRAWYRRMRTNSACVLINYS